MKIYTKTGDEGTTSLVGGKRVPKTDIRIEAYGTVDELNSHIGLLAAYCQLPASRLSADDLDLSLLADIQQHLFVVGGYLATEHKAEASSARLVLSEEATYQLEDAIDRLTSTLPIVHTFLLPGGSVAASQAHVCRTVCRRAERAILRLHEKEKIEQNVLRFVNRLSDYLFVFSRKLNIVSETSEKKWNIPCK